MASSTAQLVLLGYEPVGLAIPKMEFVGLGMEYLGMELVGLGKSLGMEFMGLGKSVGKSLGLEQSLGLARRLASTSTANLGRRIPP